MVAVDGNCPETSTPEVSHQLATNGVNSTPIANANPMFGNQIDGVLMLQQQLEALYRQIQMQQQMVMKQQMFPNANFLPYANMVPMQTGVPPQQVPFSVNVIEQGLQQYSTLNSQHSPFMQSSLPHLPNGASAMQLNNASSPSQVEPQNVHENRNCENGPLSASITESSPRVKTPTVQASSIREANSTKNEDHSHVDEIKLLEVDSCKRSNLDASDYQSVSTKATDEPTETTETNDLNLRQTTNPFDEVPVGGGNTGKTFEQLLNDNLSRNRNNSTSPRNANSIPLVKSDESSVSTVKRPFLKRGSGLKRYSSKKEQKLKEQIECHDEQFKNSEMAEYQSPKMTHTVTTASEKSSRKITQRVTTKSTTEKTRTQGPTAVPLKEFVQTAIKDIGNDDKYDHKEEVSHSNLNEVNENMGLDRFEDVKGPENDSEMDDPFSPFKPREPKNRIQIFPGMGDLAGQPNGSVEDLELFELLEQAADTSGCSNVSMLLQYIASNPSVANLPAQQTQRNLNSQLQTPQESNLHDGIHSTLDNSREDVQNDHLDVFRHENVASAPEPATSFIEQDLEQAIAEMDRAYSPESERIPISPNVFAPQQLFNDESCFDDTIANISTDSDPLDTNVCGVNVRQDEKDEISGPSKSDNPIDFIGSISSTSDSVVAGSIVPVRSSTPPMRKVASKRIESSVDTDMHIDADPYNEPDVQQEPVRKMEQKKVIARGLFPTLDFSDPKVTYTKGALHALEEDKKPDEGDGDASSMGGSVMNAKLAEKLKTLDDEIKRYRQENAAIEQIRKEKEKKLQEFNVEVSSFQKQRDEELKRIENYKQQETAALKKERKLFEEAQRVAKESLTKREREEVESLKKRISTLENEIKSKEIKWKKTLERLNKTVETQKHEIGELKAANQQLERLRIEQMKKQSSSDAMAKKQQKPTSALDLINKKISSHQLSHTIPGNTLSNSKQRKDAPKLQNDVQQPNIPKCTTIATISHLSKSGSALKSSTVRKTASVSFDQNSLSDCSSSESRPAKLGAQNSFQCDDAMSEQNRLQPEMIIRSSLKSSLNAIPEDVSNNEDTSSYDVIENKLADGRTEFVFNNGTRKEISADQKSVTIFFFNGDYKKTCQDGSVLYYYAATKTTQTKYPDGLEVLQFECGQMEKHFKDGTKEIFFPDKSVKLCYPDGQEETTLSDGTVLRVDSHSLSKTIFYPNGQKEIHTQQFKKREYPDGTCKIQYPDGRQETRYASGRVRIKSSAGEVLVDQHLQQESNVNRQSYDVDSRRSVDPNSEY